MFSPACAQEATSPEPMPPTPILATTILSFAPLRPFRARTPSGIIVGTESDVAAAHDTVRPHTVRRRLPRALTDALAALARHQRVTLNTVVQGAYALLLSRIGLSGTGSRSFVGFVAGLMLAVTAIPQSDQW